MGRGHRVADICYNFANFEPELLSGGVQSISSSGRHARCSVGKIKVFSDLKINISYCLFPGLLTTRACGNESPTYGLFRKSALGAVRL